MTDEEFGNKLKQYLIDNLHLEITPTRTKYSDTISFNIQISLNDEEMVDYDAELLTDYMV